MNYPSALEYQGYVMPAGIEHYEFDWARMDHEQSRRVYFRQFAMTTPAEVVAASTDDSGKARSQISRVIKYSDEYSTQIAAALAKAGRE